MQHPLLARVFEAIGLHREQVVGGQDQRSNLRRLVVPILDPDAHPGPAAFGVPIEAFHAVRLARGVERAGIGHRKDRDQVPGLGEGPGLDPAQHVPTALIGRPRREVLDLPWTTRPVAMGRDRAAGVGQEGLFAAVHRPPQAGERPRTEHLLLVSIPMALAASVGPRLLPDGDDVRSRYGASSRSAASRDSATNAFHADGSTPGAAGAARAGGVGSARRVSRSDRGPRGRRRRVRRGRGRGRAGNPPRTSRECRCDRARGTDRPRTVG